MLYILKKHVLAANQAILQNKLGILTQGNVSGINKSKSLIVIKPSGMPFNEITTKNISVVNIKGELVSGAKPSTDLPTHHLLYKNLPMIGSIVHTHSHYASVFSQIGISIPVLGTTHADHFKGPIPITEQLKDDDINSNYESNIGKSIINALKMLSPVDMPAVLVKHHGPFCFGRTPQEAIQNAIILEEVAKLAFHTLFSDNQNLEIISRALVEKHFYRKNGPNAYYGQTN